MALFSPRCAAASAAKSMGAFNVLCLFLLFLLASPATAYHGGVRRPEAPRLLATGEKRPVYLYVNTIRLWSNVCADLQNLPDSGITHIIMAFFLNGAAADAVLAWSGMKRDERRACVDAIHSKGGKVLLSTGGATETPYVAGKGGDYGRKAAKATIDLLMDGLDFDLEGLQPGFENSSLHYQFLLDASRAAREYFDQHGRHDMTIAHAPQAPYMTSWAGPNSGYVKLMKELGPVVDKYLVQYYNQQAYCPYETYEEMFTVTRQGCWAPHGAWKEIKAALGNDESLISKVVIGKPATSVDIFHTNTGYIPAVQLKEMLCRAERELGYRAGIMAWSHRYTSNEWPAFVDNVPGNMCVPGGGDRGPGEGGKGPDEGGKGLGEGGKGPGEGGKGPDEGGKGPGEEKGGAAGGCYHNEKGVWWLRDCTSPKLCLLADDIENSDDCASRWDLSGNVWAADEEDCRQIRFKAKACEVRGLPMTPDAGDTEGCYVNVDKWWSSDCNDKALCRLAGYIKNKTDCMKERGLIWPVWAKSEGECRKIRQKAAHCNA